jgi:hypothetical protein
MLIIGPESSVRSICCADIALETYAAEFLRRPDHGKRRSAAVDRFAARDLGCVQIIKEAGKGKCGECGESTTGRQHSHRFVPLWRGITAISGTVHL